MRLLLGCAVVAAAACGGRYRTELAGSGAAAVTPRGAGPPAEAPAAGGVHLPAGVYDVAIAFDLPRAQRVEWRLGCGAIELAGELGETLEAYRVRRLRELHRDRADAANVAGAIADTILPGTGEAAAAATAASAPPPMLPVTDVGGGRVRDTVRIETPGDSTCTLHAVADDAAVRGTYRVTRIRDLDAEARARRAAVTAGAVEVRARVAARLVTLGADPDVDATVRGMVITYLTGTCNADPARREQRTAVERHSLELRLAGDPEAAARLEADAQVVRQRLRGYLVTAGARVRPPRPPPPVEVPGDPPILGATWVAGAWAWSDESWRWTAGAWAAPDRTIGADAGAYISGPAVLPETRVRDHRDDRKREKDKDRKDRDKDKDEDRRSSRTRDHRRR